MKQFIGILIVSLIAAIPFMWFVATVDPVRQGIDLQTYIICLLSVISTLYIFVHISNKCDREQYQYMRSDGLSEETIKRIVGDESYERFRSL